MARYGKNVPCSLESLSTDRRSSGIFLYRGINLFHRLDTSLGRSDKVIEICEGLDMIVGMTASGSGNDVQGRQRKP